MLNKVFELIARVKVYYGASGWYSGIIGLCLTIANFKILYTITISAYILIPIALCFIIFLGWFEYTFIVKRQQRHLNKQNDMKYQLDEIEKKLDTLIK